MSTGKYLVFLLCLRPVLGSCNYNLPELSVDDDFYHSTALNSSESRIRLFLNISLSDCENECILRKYCTAYVYHRITHFCELHTGEIDLSDDRIAERRESMLRLKTRKIQANITDICEDTDCPAGSACTCGDERITCKVTECEEPPNPDNVIILGNRFHVGSKRSSLCVAGYAPVSGVGVTRVCQANGKWSGEDPVCGKACGPLVTPRNGNLTSNVRNVFPALAQFGCDDEYLLIGSPVLRCEEDGLWNDTSPSCRADVSVCALPAAPAHGSVSIDNTVALALFQCDPGYEFSGSAALECQPNGQWNDSAPTCDLLDCGSLESPENGTVSTADETTFGSSVTYTCDEGFDLTGTASRTCSQDGHWSDAPPTCDIKDCGNPGEPQYGSVDIASGTTFGATVTYTCTDGYELVGSVSRICSSNGFWEDDLPICERIDCGNPGEPEYGSVDIANGTTFGATVIYTCTDGYELVGSASRICSSNGLWEDDLPICQRIDCGNPGEPEYGSVDIATGTTFGATVTYTCTDGYELVGTVSRICLSNGLWEGDLPICQRIETMFQACSDDSDCSDLNSECRFKKCGCVMGQSYLPGQFECVSACLEYGTSFQQHVVEQLYIQDSFLTITSYGYTLPQCKHACINYDCRSVNYDPHKQECQLSKKSSSLLPQSLTHRVVYLHRDCACPSLQNECSGCGIRPAVPNAALVDTILPDGAVLGTELGVKLVYACNYQHHMHGATRVVSECRDGIWTNLDAACQHETHNQMCTNDQDCLEFNSECRHGICVCKIGFSYLQPNFTCTLDCEQFGDTFQYIDDHYFKVESLEIISDVDFNECKMACLAVENNIPGTICKSADYEAVHRICRVYQQSAADTPAMLAPDENGLNFTYLHRDCACLVEDFCKACFEMEPVTNAKLRELQLPQNAVWGTEQGAVHVYTCDDGYHISGNTSITITCESNQMWTYPFYGCEPESMFQPCTEDWACTEPDSECRANTCGCKLGYSYFPSLYICSNSECPVYGTTFQEFQDTWLNTDDFMILDVSTPAECQKHCVAALQEYGTECKAVNYNPVELRCHLKAESVLLLQDRLEPSQLTYYHRDCEHDIIG